MLRKKTNKHKKFSAVFFLVILWQMNSITVSSVLQFEGQTDEGRDVNFTVAIFFKQTNKYEHCAYPIPHSMYETSLWI